MVALLEMPFVDNNFREPKMLDCGHTYCWPCIQRLISSQPNYSNSRRHTIKCPQCRESITVPAKGLKTNHLIKCESKTCASIV